MEEKIPKRRGVEDACVEKDGESGHGAGALVSHAQFLRLRGQGVQRVLALAPDFFHVGHEILELEPSACANLVVGDFSRLEKFDQIRTGNMEQVGRFLGGEFVMGGNEGDGVAPGHLVEDFQKHAECGFGNLHRLILGTCGNTQGRAA